MLGSSPVLRRRAELRRNRIGLASRLGVMCLLALWITPTLSAQAPVTWTEPLVLAEPATSWSRPSIAADPWGRVHVVWSDRYGAARLASGQDDQYGDTLYHTYWDGFQWAEPLDIIIGDTSGATLTHPDITVDASGQIYLTWSTQGGLHFATAPALDAHDAASWQPRRIVAQGLGFEESRLVADPDGRLHVVCVKLEGDLAGNLLYTRSADEGLTWSLPSAISEVYAAGDTVSVAPEMVRDAVGWLHAVWSERSAPDWIGRRIMYARSEDDGLTWTRPERLAERQLEGGWAEHPSLVTTDDRSLHLVWVCGGVQRCYRASGDGGRTWSRTERIFDDLRSSAGGDALVADHEGNLHLIAQLRYPSGVYYASRPNGGSWHQPVLLVSEPEFHNGHYYDAALSDGNQLHAVWQKDSSTGDVTHVRITTSAAPLGPLAVPSPTVTSSLTPASRRMTPAIVTTSGSPGMEHVSVLPNTRDPEPAGKPLSATQAVLLGILPSVVLTAAVVVVRLMREPRRPKG